MIKDRNIASDAGIDPSKLAFDPSLGSVSGKTFWVDSTNGDSGHDGESKDRAVATLAQAVALCRADKGDVILIQPWHTETVTAVLTVNKATISIVGLGQGDKRPTFTFTTATSSCIDVTAKNVNIFNIRFKSGIASQVTCLDIGNAYCHVKGCEFTVNGGLEALHFIKLTSADSDNAWIEDCEIYSAANGADSGINIFGQSTKARIERCWIDGDFDLAPIYSSTVHVGCLIAHNVLKNDDADELALEFSAAATGVLAYNSYIASTTQATAADPGSCRSIENYHCDTVDVSGILSPAGT